MADFILEWNDSTLQTRLEIAAANAVSDTADEAADWMRKNHPWENYTGLEEMSIFSEGPFHEVGDRVWAQAGALQQPWGFRGSPQLRLPAMYLEFGHHSARSKENPTGLPGVDARPFIRPAAAAVFPTIFARLRNW